MKNSIHTVSGRQFFFRLFVSLGLLITLSTSIHASHIRAGEIIARRIDNFVPTYEFTFIGYRDNVTSARFGNGIFSYGDGETEEVPLVTNEVQISQNLFRVEFRLVHTYPANGAYTVSYIEEFRNEGIANMASSAGTAFYVESQIVIDGIAGLNSTPRFTFPPIDDGKVGLAYLHNPVAFDPDDDSLSYELVIPQKDRELSVDLYRLPNDPEFYQVPEEGNQANIDFAEFSIDEDGNLLWDAPGEFLNLAGNECPDGVARCAEYNVAFRVREWKKIGGAWLPYGYVTRDMQITISEGENEPPEIAVPEAICVEAGTLIQETVTATDPDGHAIELSAFGGPFRLPNPAMVSPDPPEFQDPPAEMTFEWLTSCGHIRTGAYTIGFRANDLPEDENGVRTGPSLSDIGTWEITVVGPAPQGLAVNLSEEGISSSWLPYSCSNADSLEIWRRVGSFDFNPNECQVGIPEGAGYQLVGEVAATEVDFHDEYGLAPGAQYCYRLVASFANGATSFASEEVCVTLPIDAPILTHVDVISTAENDGEISVRWIPANKDGNDPTIYDLFRFDNLSGTGDSELVVSGLQQTEFVDQRLNTLRSSYGYQVIQRSSAEVVGDTSAFASQVQLTLDPGVQEIGMEWEANVPWSNQSQAYPFHYIYRSQVSDVDPDELVLIDSVRSIPGSFKYIDDGSILQEALDEETEYCYFVTTVGSYANSPDIPEPLLNRSPIKCARPNDITPPCEPLAPQIVNLNQCDLGSLEPYCDGNFENELVWNQTLAGADCDSDVELYNIYFSESGLDTDYVIIASIGTTTYLHAGLNSFKGCYRISAVDRSGNESELSEEICNDNCPELLLPNVFTPNQDGKNDTFVPFATLSDGDGLLDDELCDLFINKIVFRVFDRTGKEVYVMSSEEPETSRHIQWDGTTNNGISLPSGVYFYEANVQFDVLARSEANKIFNGWVQILK